MLIKKKRCITLSTLFTGFTETLKNLREWYQYTKQGKLKEFYELLSDFKNHKSVIIETKNRKNRIINDVNQLCNKYFDTYKKITIVRI